LKSTETRVFVEIRIVQPDFSNFGSLKSTETDNLATFPYNVG